MVRSRVERIRWSALCMLTMGLTGCHSHYVQTTIANHSAADLTVVQVDYPSASFGVQHLVPGQVFHYRFKVLGSGPLKLDFFDAHQGEHTQVGPVLHEGQEGQLEIAFPNQAHAEFHSSLTP